MNIQKMQKIQKILAIVMMVMMLISTVSTVVMAADTKDTLPKPSSITAQKGSVDSSTITTAGKQIVYILQTVGIVLSVVVLIIIGIKYMMGSAEEKAEYKKTLLPYVIGAALIFAASIFAQVAYDFFSGITTTTGNG